MLYVLLICARLSSGGACLNPVYLEYPSYAMCERERKNVTAHLLAVHSQSSYGSYAVCMTKAK
jgi:hypothetical protein